MTLKNLICAFAFTMLLFSCKKKDDGQLPQNSCALSESIIDYTQTINLTDTTTHDTAYSYSHYSSANLLTTVSSQTGNTFQTLTYPDNLTTIQISTYSPTISNTTRYYNTQGKIVRMTNYQGNGANDTQSRSVTEFNYYVNGNVVSSVDSVYFASENFQIAHGSSSVYQWAGGNLIMQDNHGPWSETRTINEYYNNIPNNIIFDRNSYLTNPQNPNLSLLNVNFLRKQTNYDANNHPTDSTVFMPTFDAGNKLTNLVVINYHNTGSGVWEFYKTLVIYHYKCKQ